MQRVWILMYLLLAFALSAGGCASTEPAYEYETKELYAERDGKQIYGVIYVPNGAGEQMPAVIFSHGFAGNYQVGTQYAQELAAHGDEDDIVPLSYSEKALGVYPSAELKVIHGGGHGFYGEDARQVTDYMLEYLDGHRV